MQTALISSKNISCSKCYRKLCKVVDKNATKLIEYRHKSSCIYASQAIVKCVGCDTMWLVTAESMETTEVDIE
jgi:hypothetical protein